MAGPHAVFRALADPTRRDILKLLRHRSMTSGEIARRFPVAWATTSRHLAILRRAGLVTTVRTGTSISYAANATVFQEFVEHLLAWNQQGATDA